MTRSFPTLLASAAGLALLAAAPAVAVTYSNHVQALQVHYDGVFDRFVYIRATDSTGPVGVGGSSDDGYTGAFASGDDGGTVSATAFGRLDQHSAAGSVAYNLLLDAPAKITSKVRVTFAGLLSAWGSGTVRAQIDLGPDSFLYFAGSVAEKPTTTAFKLTRTITLTGGTPIAVGLSGVASVNFNRALGDGHLGFASAYVDPVLTFSAAVPEPATWALLIAGFGMTGVAARRRRSTARAV